jgi:hypothetical protein
MAAPSCHSETLRDAISTSLAGKRTVISNEDEIA